MWVAGDVCEDRKGGLVVLEGYYYPFQGGPAPDFWFSGLGRIPFPPPLFFSFSTLNGKKGHRYIQSRFRGTLISITYPS